MFPEVITHEILISALDMISVQAINNFIQSRIQEVLREPSIPELFSHEYSEIEMIFEDFECEFDVINGENMNWTRQESYKYVTERYTLWKYIERNPNNIIKDLLLENRQTLLTWAGTQIVFPYGNPPQQDGEAQNKEFFALIWSAFLRARFEFLLEQCDVSRREVLGRYRLVD